MLRDFHVPKARRRSVAAGEDDAADVTRSAMLARRRRPWTTDIRRGCKGLSFGEGDKVSDMSMLLRAVARGQVTGSLWTAGMVVR